MEPRVWYNGLGFRVYYRGLQNRWRVLECSLLCLQNDCKGAVLLSSGIVLSYSYNGYNKDRYKGGDWVKAYTGNGHSKECKRKVATGLYVCRSALKLHGA